MELKPIIVARQLGLLVFYSGALLASLWLSYELRFDFRVGPEYLQHIYLIVAGMLGLKLLLLLVFGQFGSLLGYFGIHDLSKIFLATFLAGVAAFAVWLFKGIAYAPPRAVIVTDLMLSFLALCAIRMGFRLLREGYFNGARELGGKRRWVGIIGAGDVGASLVRDLLVRRGLGIRPVAFFDDDPKKWGTSIHGVAVAGAPETIPDYIKKHKLDEVVIAMPSASGKRIRELVQMFARVGLKHEIVPSIEELMTGKVRTSQIRPVEIQDLLGREAVDLEFGRIRDLIQGNVILVTGAGGSIGAELCRQIASNDPQRLLLVERCEVQLFQIEQELIDLGHGSVVVPLVADILDEPRLRGILETFKPTVVFHAAAHKHVPMMEYQPAEAFRNNTVGSQKFADLCVALGVKRFVLISTDKAINPTSVMGATKRLAEIYIQALQRNAPAETKFMAVRFGNVLGSSGSVIPTFKKQIAAGGPVTITHPEITRYFMTVREAVGLVLQSVAIGSGGEIFVLDMGKPIKIVDMAHQLIELSGFEPEVDIEIKVTGLRPGEKLFEELNHCEENHLPTPHPRIFRFVADPLPLDRVRDGLIEIAKKAPHLEGNQLKLEIQKLIPEYKPYLFTA